MTRRSRAGSTTSRSSISKPGRHAEAIAMFERALALRERTLGPGHPDARPQPRQPRSARTGRSRRQKRLERLPTSAAAVAGPPPPPPPSPPPPPRPEVRSRRHRGRRAEPGEHRRHGAGRRPSTRSPAARARARHPRARARRASDHPTLASSLTNLALMDVADGAFGPARVRLERALAIREHALDATPMTTPADARHSAVADSLLHLGKLADVATGQHAQGLQRLERAVALPCGARSRGPLRGHGRGDEALKVDSRTACSPTGRRRTAVQSCAFSSAIDLLAPQGSEPRSRAHRARGRAAGSRDSRYLYVGAASARTSRRVVASN